ncbi:hypothetical protein A1O7_06833 [Cladophialophora yegresii CBS 114405]|uniref:DUF3824 domain-containing protein n=1 Tax=Cladophialophora yegresii CBS 114405 TaxID=1182544 RepID=W9WD84_9EURO|nr:uncharacterized protein A1O7_06833 [Cladophialophora yegresii CBS 114405]EXJ56489.1 hypothetical protein A1O7_06833 [Cladophialophora yegresii CBS 114405]
MGSVYRDRYDDSRTSVSSARRDGGYTTVKRYIVKEDDRDSRSSVGRARTFVPERAGERVEETRIVRREIDEPAREIRREEPARIQERELVIRRERDESPPRARSVVYDARREEPVQERELIIRRTAERDEPRRDDFEVARYDERKVVDTRYRDDYEMLSPRGYDDRDVQRYSRTTDYFAPAPPPQTIIIRQEPIIIRERVRDDDYQIVRKSDIDDERSMVRSRDPPPRSPRGEEDFFYEKKVRERVDHRRDDDDYYERRSRRRSVSPHDSVSQRGRDYSSDDSMVYVRKEVREESASPDRKRGLAAGVLAGVGAAELLRNHKRKEGQDVSHGVGRVGRDLGAGALGALAAEGIHRARSMHRSRSRRRHSRSRSDSRSRRHRSRSRSESPSKLKTLGAVGLGAAALAAAATIATKRMNKKNGDDDDRRGRSHSRSRSRRRAESVSSIENDPDAPSDDARNPKHRRNTIAKAGAGGAVVAALIEHARSKSRARDGKERSRSRIRQALPVIAAGLGSAAVAGVYEKHKAKKEAEEIVDKNRRARSRSRSRARSEHSAYYDGPPPPQNDQSLVEYGNTPMYGNNFGADYYGRPPPQEGYYSSAVVPAAAGAAAGYGAQRGTRSRSRSLSRDRGGRRDRSSSSSPDRGGRRHSRDAARVTAAAAAGAAGASEAERRRQERRERRARRRQHEEGYGRDPYEDNNYAPGGQYAPTPPPPAHDPYATQQGFYPQSSQFPPPPGSIPQQYPPQAGPGMAPPPPGSAPYGQQGYPPPPPPPGAPPAPAQPYDAYASGANPYAPRGPENVSAEPSPVFGNPFAPTTPMNDQNHIPDGLNRAAPGPFPAARPPFASTQPSSNPAPPIPPSTSTYEPPIPGPSPAANLARQETYPPPFTRGVSPPRSQSQPPSTSRKSVQFADKPEFSDGAPLESEPSSPELRHRRPKHSHARGYEAGDDTDSTPDEMRRGNRESSSRSLHPDSAETERRRHRRRRSHEPQSSRGGPSSSSKGPELERVASPADSDATIELPPRFDEKGRRKTSPGDDPLADRLDEILAGKGAAGKLFGNFLDGIFGPEGRKSKGR